MERKDRAGHLKVELHAWVLIRTPILPQGLSKRTLLQVTWPQGPEAETRAGGGIVSAIFGSAQRMMSPLEKRKAELIEQLAATNDERVIAAVEETLAGNAHYALTKEQQRQLDASLQRYLRGEAKTYSPEQARALARKAART